MSDQQHLGQEQLEAFFYATLDSESAKDMADHIADCPECQAELDAMIEDELTVDDLIQRARGQ